MSFVLPELLCVVALVVVAFALVVLWVCWLFGFVCNAVWFVLQLFGLVICWILFLQLLTVGFVLLLYCCCSLLAG